MAKKHMKNLGTQSHLRATYAFIANRTDTGYVRQYMYVCTYLLHTTIHIYKVLYIMHIMYVLKGTLI